MKKILLLSALLIANLSNAQSWQNLGTNGIVSLEPIPLLSKLSIAITSDNVPYVSQIETANFSQPSVKRLNGNGWVYNGVSINNDQNTYSTSMALDSNNVPYIAFSYFDQATSTNKSVVKKFDGTGWIQVGTTDFATGTIGDIILKIDSNNVPYVAYNGFGNPENIVIKKLVSNNWVTQTSVTSGQVFNFDFTISGTVPYITYDRLFGQNVQVFASKLNGAIWQNLGSFGIVSNNGSKPTIAIDANNNPTIAFLTGNNPDLIVKKYNSNTNSWDNLGTTVATENIDNPKLAIGSNNTAILAYKDIQNNGIINVKKWTGTTWDLITTPTSFEPIQEDFALAIGSNNIPYITYATDTAVRAKFYGTTLATTQNEIFQDLKLYPNPTTGFLNIDTKEYISKIVITNLLGKTVFESNDNFSKIDISNLGTGIYLVKIQAEGLEKTYKISKNTNNK